MKTFPVILIFFILLAASLALAGCTSPDTTTIPETKNNNTADREVVAANITASIDAGLGDLRAGLRNNSRALSTTNLSGREAETILADNLLHFPWALSSVVISRDGIILAAAPKNYEGIVGENVSGHDFFQKSKASQAPMVSGVFRMVEGFDAIGQSYPIFSPSGEYLGYTDITYEPYAFLSRHVGEATSGTAYGAWVAQTDGTVIYDIHEEEIGSNILSDPAYADPVLKEIFTRIAKEPSGTGSYIFHDDTWSGNVTKTVFWDTAGIDGVEWRVVVTSTSREGGVTVTGVPATGGEVTDARYANLTRFVDRAAAYAQEHGKEAAIREFNNPNGTFIEGELYVFAYEMNGTVIALPFQQGLLGTGRKGISDSNGVEFIDGLINAALYGGGYLYYIYPNPEDAYREEFKLSYVRPVNDEWFVGSGIYLPELPAVFSTTERDDLTSWVKQAQNYAQVQGAKKAISGFNDRNGTFSDGSRYIFAYGYNGTTLALPFQPGLIGSNRLEYTDPYGVKILPWMISVSKRGGGFVYLDYLNPDTGAVGLKLCYVAPVDGEWFVGSGIYTWGL